MTSSDCEDCEGGCECHETYLVELTDPASQEDAMMELGQVVKNFGSQGAPVFLGYSG